MGAGPGQEDSTISSKNFEKAIKNLPKTKSSIILSGGEIFTIKNQPYEFLEILNNENKYRQEGNKINIGIQSNGFWAKNMKQTEKVLDTLLDYNVSSLDVASNDDYHFEKGLSKENLWNIEAYSENYYEKIKKGLNRKPIEVYIRGNEGFVMPMGSAKNLKEDEYIDFFATMGGGSFCKDSPGDYQLTVDNKGKVYNCCFQVFPLKGNLINEKLEDIVKKSQKDKRLSIIEKEGIAGLAKHDGWDEDFIDWVTLNGQNCDLCYQAYIEPYEK